MVCRYTYLLQYYLLCFDLGTGFDSLGDVVHVIQVGRYLYLERLSSDIMYVYVVDDDWDADRWVGTY